MSELEKLRKEFDAVDDEIVAALNRRFALAAKMRELKRREGLPPVDPKREAKIYAKVTAAVPVGERDTIFGVYERILGGSRGVIETIARGVLVREGKVLLCKAKDAKTTYLPGGHIEFGETGAEALRREMREETALAVRVGELLGVVENSFDQADKRHAEINLVYAMTLDDPAADCVSQEDWIEFVWWPLAELETAKLLPAAMLKQVVAATK